MGRANPIMARILAELEAEREIEERPRREAIERALAAGPPAGSGITSEAWASWHRYGFMVCPGEKRDLICQNEACRCWARCATLAAKGLYGNGDPLPRADRPLCGAQTRAGSECRMRVEPGKHRCRLHGGRSTGAKTAEGIERIREVQRRHWAKAPT